MKEKKTFNYSQVFKLKTVQQAWKLLFNPIFASFEASKPLNELWRHISTPPTTSKAFLMKFSFLFFSAFIFFSREHWAIWRCPWIFERARHLRLRLDWINAPDECGSVLLDVSSAAEKSSLNCNYPHKVLSRDEIIPFFSPQLFSHSIKFNFRRDT